MKNDKYVIERWLELYNRLNRSSYKVIDWPDKDSTKQAIDALCRDDSGNLLGIEHTLIQPFEGEKSDTARFARTLAKLEGHPGLVQPGFMIEVGQPVGSVPKGTDWNRIGDELLTQLRNVLPTLLEGSHRVPAEGGGWSFHLVVSKRRLPGDPGKVFVERIWPGDPGPELIIKALKDKVPKLSAFQARQKDQEDQKIKKILLLEKDGIAGTIESQFAKLPVNPETEDLLRALDEVWSTNTSALQTEGVIFTNQVWPHVRAFTGSLNLQTGEFWQRAS